MKKNNSIKPKIIEEKNEIDDHLLDIIGNEFKFDHEKGLSEWLKNSVDAYIRNNVPDNKQNIIFNFNDLDKKIIFECIDFVGMEEKDIIEAFKRWGDPNAAKRGLNKRVYGGHGNGGKFYMRQMFKSSYFITYKNGYLNVYGFNENKKYGFAVGYKNLKLEPEAALHMVNLNSIPLPSHINKQILNKITGFTIIRGLGPKGIKNEIKVNNIIKKLINHPQAQNILSRANVSVIYNNEIVCELLKPQEIKPKLGFEEPRKIIIPKEIYTLDNGEMREVRMTNSNFVQGHLILKISETAFSRNSMYEGLNRVDFIGEIGIIASYKLTELDVRNYPQAAFIYGECRCPILEDSEEDSVKNDRTKLNESILTKALLEWISKEIDKLASEIASKENIERKEKGAKLSSAFNDYLNQWKNKFMKKILSDSLGDIYIRHIGNDVLNGKKSVIKKSLETPDNIEFSYSMAKIPVNEEYNLTLKAKISKFIPVGSRIIILTDNKHILLIDNTIVIKSEFVKIADDTKNRVAVMNIKVKGDEVGVKGIVTAKIGKLSTEIEVYVVKKNSEGINKKQSYPTVLLSGIDGDPLNIAIGGKVILDQRQPLIYQRPQDIKDRIYWINTASPLASNILEILGENSVRWRDYLFQRYVDIFVKEALFELQQSDPESFSAERIDSDILGTLTTKLHTIASKDLAEFLFNDHYELPKYDKTGF